MRKSLVLLLVLAALAGGYVALLPARSAWTPPAEEGAVPPVRGAFHVHSSRSDGTGSVEEIAVAAERAGLRFVVLTDHGDGTRTPSSPAYYGSVLVLDAVEVSTFGGHVIALGIGQAPYPLAGEPRDVVEDIRRLGGLAIAAHPTSGKAELRWTGGDAPLDGVEWLNADSEWRDESPWALSRSLLAYPVRRPEAVAALFDRPGQALALWDTQTLTQRTVGLASPDAHARVGLRSLGEPYDSNIVLRVPSYEAMFRALSIELNGVTLGEDAAADAATVIAAIRAGHVTSHVDALGRQGMLRFSARSGANEASAGDTLAIDGPVTLRIDTIAPDDALIAIVQDGKPYRIANGTPIEESRPAEPGVYRVEVRLPGAPGQPPVPWIVSNPIYVGRSQAPATADIVPRATSVSLPIYSDGEATTATIERNTDSQGAIDVVAAVPGRQLLFRYAVGGRSSDSPYAAIAFPVTGMARYDRVTLTIRADHALRLAVQLRVPGGVSGERWRRSIYVDETARTITIPFADLAPVTAAQQGRVPLDRIDSLLVVADAVNTPLGGSGTVWVDDVRLER